MQASIYSSVFGLLGITLWYITGNMLFFLIVAIMPLALVIGLRLPFLLALGFVIFSFFRLHEVFPQLYPLKIPQLLALGAIGSFAVSVMMQKISFYWRSELTIFAVFFVFCTIGVVFASNRPVAMDYWINIYSKIGVMVFIIAWLIQKPSQLLWTMRLIILSGLLVAVVTIKNKLLGIGLIEGTRVTIGRDLGSVLGDPNDLSLVLLFAFSFAVSALINKSGNWFDKLIGTITTFTIIYAIICTQSRGGLLGMCAVIGTFCWYRVENKALLLGVGVAALSILFIIAGISGRESGGAHEEGLDESASIRLHAWMAAFRMGLHNPFTGVGLDNYYYNFYFYSDFWDNKNHAVHSTWFGVMAETGFVGFVLFITMISKIFFSIKNSLSIFIDNPQIKPVAEALLAGIISFLISGTFLTQGFTWPIYIILALTTAIAHMAEISQKSSDS